MTVHGDGSQTRSLCYVADLIEGIWRAANSELPGPINLGNTEEISMGELAELIRDLAGSDSSIGYTQRPVDDPEMRRPDTTLARDLLEWTPRIPLREGLAKHDRVDARLPDRNHRRSSTGLKVRRSDD